MHRSDGRCLPSWRSASSALRLGGCSKPSSMSTGLAAPRRRCCGEPPTRAARLSTPLAIAAVRLTLGSVGGGDGEQSARDWTAFLLSQPLGRWLAVAVGVMVAAAGIAFGLAGWKATFARRLALDQGTRRWVIPMGRFGYMARGVVFLVIGGFLVLAALHANAREAKGSGGALAALEDQPYGWALLGVTALGLFAFGAFEFIEAAYRRIDAPSLEQAADQIKDHAKMGGQALGRSGQ